MKIISFVSLATGKEKFGWDKNGISADMEIYFNTDTLELTLRSSQSLPKVAVHSQVTTDLFGKSTSDTRAAGPLADSGANADMEIGASRGSGLTPRMVETFSALVSVTLGADSANPQE